MINENNILNNNDYHVNKGFHRQVKGPLNYLIKIIGIDCEPKTAKQKKTKVCKEQIILAPNEKFSEIVFTFFLMKTMRRRMRRRGLKRKRYEEVEATV